MISEQERIRRAISIESDYAGAYNNRGVVYDKIRKNDKALSDYRKAARLDPQEPLYHSNTGIILNRMKRYKEAVTSFNKTIKLDPGFVKAYKYRADAYEALGQTAKAERDKETYKAMEEE